MIVFDVKDMSCGHCASTITKAVQGADAAAVVRVDLAAHRVEIESDRAGADELATVIEEAGYTPVEM